MGSDLTDVVDGRVARVSCIGYRVIGGGHLRWAPSQRPARPASSCRHPPSLWDTEDAGRWLSGAAAPLYYIRCIPEPRASIEVCCGEDLLTFFRDHDLGEEHTERCRSIIAIPDEDKRTSRRDGRATCQEIRSKTSPGGRILCGNVSEPHECSSFLREAIGKHGNIFSYHTRVSIETS